MTFVISSHTTTQNYLCILTDVTFSLHPFSTLNISVFADSRALSMYVRPPSCCALLTNIFNSSASYSSFRSNCIVGSFENVMNATCVLSMPTSKPSMNFTTKFCRVSKWSRTLPEESTINAISTTPPQAKEKEN